MRILLINLNKYKNMDFNDVTKDLLDKNEHELEQRFDELMRSNPRYRNLDGED